MIGAPGGDRGQAGVLLVVVAMFVLGGALALGSVAQVLGGQGDDQQAADLGALAAAKRMGGAYARVFEPAFVAGKINAQTLTRAAYLDLGRRTASAAARANGAGAIAVSFPGARGQIAPTQIAVRVGDATATAELVPSAGSGPLFGLGANNQYNGPFAYRQGQPMRPDVAPAFDRMAAAARHETGLSLIINSAWRSNAEQAILFAHDPDPKWVARPGTSLHRMGTELDLGPPAAIPWLKANATRFHFLQRYAWEDWHYGYTLNPSSAPDSADGRVASTLPSFVPAAYVPDIVAASQHWSVSGILLAAQIAQESNFDPGVVSSAGAEGIAQFMPGTAAAIGLRDPFDPKQAIDAQAHLMRDLLRRFASVSLALAAYNAGEGPVAACGCVPPFPETVAYVAAILGRLNGAGDPQSLTLRVRLVS